MLAPAAGHGADPADRGLLPSAAEQTTRTVVTFARGARALLPLRAEPVTPPATRLLLLGHGGLHLSWQRIARYARRGATVDRGADRRNGVPAPRWAAKRDAGGGRGRDAAASWP
jgi:hypothetical protein